jgi:hypothetical protein
MAQRRHHYEQAFEHYLRTRRIPYVAVDEAKKALLPEEARFRPGALPAPEGEAASLKSFDFVLYGPERNLLCEVKGRKLGGGRGARRGSRLECWVTQEDVQSLGRWERLFGEGFTAAFVFIYWCDQQPALPLFEEIFEFHQRWYAVRAVTLASYAAGMRPRSQRWQTVHMPAAEFDRASRGLCGRLGGVGGVGGVGPGAGHGLVLSG